jgi:hypothetical protein
MQKLRFLLPRIVRARILVEISVTKTALITDTGYVDKSLEELGVRGSKALNIVSELVELNLTLGTRDLRRR